MRNTIKKNGKSKRQQHMTAVLKLSDQTIYNKLIKRFPLRPISTELENEKAAQICDELTDHLNDLSPAEKDYLEVLTDLIAKYESRWDSETPSMSPQELIQYLMEQNNLSQSNLIGEFGSPSRVSEFLHGKRNLSLEQAKKLSKRFKLKLTALLAG